MMASGIYKIENAATGCCYIGSAVHLVNRWATHRRGLRKGEHRNRYLQRVWSDESRAKLSASCVGRRLPDETLARMAASKCKPVECVDTGVTYKSVKEASRSTGAYYSNISAACLGRRKLAGGFSFTFVK